MTKKQSVRKGLRFEVFRRDGFTCQYCGRQPPEVVLHVDHIRPVAEGGTDEEMNLVTSCQDCNLGKGKALLDKPQSPDASLAWLETQQEIAELKAYQELKMKRDELLEEVIDNLQAVWLDYSGGGWYPADGVMRQLLSRYDPDVVERGIVVVAVKVAANSFRRDGDWLPYLWGTLRRMTAETENDEAPAT
jgi:hypothetical protein